MATVNDPRYRAAAEAAIRNPGFPLPINPNFAGQKSIFGSPKPVMGDLPKASDDAVLTMEWRHKILEQQNVVINEFVKLVQLNAGLMDLTQFTQQLLGVAAEPDVEFKPMQELKAKPGYRLKPDETWVVRVNEQIDGQIVVPADAKFFVMKFDINDMGQKNPLGAAFTQIKIQQMHNGFKYVSIDCEKFRTMPAPGFCPSVFNY